VVGFSTFIGCSLPAPSVNRSPTLTAKFSEPQTAVVRPSVDTGAQKMMTTMKPTPPKPSLFALWRGCYDRLTSRPAPATWFDPCPNRRIRLNRPRSILIRDLTRDR